MISSAFYDTIRPTLGKWSNLQIDGFERVLAEAKRRNLNIYFTAYILATSWWESANTMQPIREMGGEAYLRSKPYYPWVGEGLVQVTWEINHRKFGAVKPGQLLTWEKALPALFDGMLLGMFTTKKLADYIKPGSVDYKGARAVVNGKDKAKEIADLALLFEKALRDAKWGAAPASPPPTPVSPAPPVVEPAPQPPATAQPVGLWARLKAWLGWA